jgi:hypothetical protein
MGNDLAVTNSTIQMYGSRDDLNLITDRLMSMHPSAKQVGTDGMRAVAQLALMMGANPLPTAGEIYVWVDWQGKTSTTLGVAYYRRKASEKDTVIWQSGNEPRPMTPQERETYGVPVGALAGLCKGLLLSEYTALLNSGVPWQEAQKMLARTSHAIVVADEMFYADNKTNRDKNRVGKPLPAPTGRTWQWVAEKRAEIGFYRIKSMVDTTLTDAMQAQAQQVLRQLGHQSPPTPETKEWLDKRSPGDWNATFFDAHQEEPPRYAIEGEYEEGQSEPEPVAESTAVEFLEGDSVMVAGNNSESLGEFVRYHLDDMAVVNINGKELKVYLNRVKQGPPAQPELIHVDGAGAYADA